MYHLNWIQTHACLIAHRIYHLYGPVSRDIRGRNHYILESSNQARLSLYPYD